MQYAYQKRLKPLLIYIYIYIYIQHNGRISQNKTANKQL